MRGNDVLEVEYGEYPQTAVDRHLAAELERAVSFGQLNLTGKSYTTDSRKYNEYSEPFSPQEHLEYEYNGRKYVKVKANSYFEGGVFQLSTGDKYRDGDDVWVAVEPIKWLVDEKADIALSKNIIFAGVQFNRMSNYTGNFDKTDIKAFLDNHFSKDIVSDFNYSKMETPEFSVEMAKRRNPYGFNFEKVSEEEIIRGAVESDVPVFLHGKSSEGKSARVKQLDPDCEIIYLRNATPDSLNGKSVYNANTGEMIDIPPAWYKKVCEKCEAEPDKIHVVFFDELTNALHSIQGMAFNIILDREVNGIWKLPENSRIVAAGNDMDDSLAANEMVEPLFNRFAHVYINTTVNDWLKWAVTPKEEYQRLDYQSPDFEYKIHPSIYAFIAYRGERALRSEYTGDRPNADPRKWEMASKMLYMTNNPEMLRGLVGEEITRDFCEFCNQQVITIEDVIEGNYSGRDFQMNTAEKYATTLGLSFVDDENLGQVREFVTELGPEFGAVFDSLWAHGDETRMETIAEIRAYELSGGGKNK